MIGIKIKIEEEAKISKALSRLANDRSIYTDMILAAYSRAVEEAFRTQGFGTWPPLKQSTILKRRGIKGGKPSYSKRKGVRNHYLLPPAAGVSAEYPANTWTAKMLDFVAGRTIAQGPLRFGRGVQNIRIRGGPSYAGYALSEHLHRDLNDTILNRIAQMMEETIRAGIVRNIDLVLTK